MENTVKKMSTDLSKKACMQNDLIKAKSNLSLNSLKLLRLTISQIIKSDTELMTYEIGVPELASLLGITRQSIYQEMDKVTTELLKEIVYIGDGNPSHKWKKFQWCSCAEYDNGIFKIKLHEELKPYLLELKGYFTSYQIESVVYLKSVYSIRLYELLQEQLRGQEVYGDKVARVRIPIDTIRKATNTEDKYEKVSMFRARVIDAAVKEIESKLNIHITYKHYKVSRQIVGYEFELKSSNYARMIGELV